MTENVLFRNPITYGPTPTVEAYRIALCPTCAKPCVSAIEEGITASRNESQRVVRYHCRDGHEWSTAWSGGSETIWRPPR
jgi:hypothetical protein